MNQSANESTSLVVKAPPSAYSLNSIALIVMAFFWISGGIYGNEEMMLKAEPRHALPALLITPLFYSLPIMMVIAELATALPLQGGCVAWVKEVGPSSLFSVGLLGFFFFFPEGKRSVF
jgi:amino acid transporter